jgi:hypothetical protein
MYMYIALYLLHTFQFFDLFFYSDFINIPAPLPVISINSPLIHGLSIFLCSHFKSVIFIGPFKISTDHYHAVVVSALCACVYKQDGFAH